MAMLQDKVAIVTGASAGIGKAAALLFAREGAAVVAVARGAQALARVVEQIENDGGRAAAVVGDVAEEATAAAAVDAAIARFGRLDVAFNNAGTLGEMGATPEVSVAGWRQTLEINLTGAFLAARQQIPAMLRGGGGALIFTSTFVGHTAGFPGVAAYAASKAGVVGLVQALAAEFGPRGLRVNALLPGGTDTAMARSMNPTPEAMAQVAALHALKRVAAPEEIARAALFLASEGASFVTGTALLADGGVSINRT
ncbi:SDR family oxidoreductase [Luteimonas aquatica]|uniref:SDR family oxidoreductase n=1 Tax=Luteimonas aquatica TaxID=450364 RepID=UPI001F584296|nr:SDR family oxidoreductase [Luteimonas aquatica]